MTNQDILQCFMFEHFSIRGEIVKLSESYQTIIKQHDYPVNIKMLLGEMLVAVSLLSANIKFEGKISIQFQGKGSVRLLLAQSDHTHGIRALAQCGKELTTEDLLTELKQGTLVITIDPETDNGQRYQGMVNWQGNSLAESIEGYFAQSEQIPTRLWIGVSEKQAAGLLIQKMPSGEKSSSDDTLTHHWEHIIHLSNTITQDELMNLDNVQIISRLYHEEEVRLFFAKPVQFKCRCSVSRSENALQIVGKAEVLEELALKQVIVVTCEFCNQEYSFDRDDIEKIFTQQNSIDDRHIH